MEHIHSIEIKYFRSIYHLRLQNLSDLNVFSGRNDAGKSNILKVLNLFFNSQTDWQTPLEFYRDFNIRRLEEVRRDTIKGKQFISIRVTFNRGPRFIGTLPERFSVTREWYRDSQTYTQRDDLASPTRKRGNKSLLVSRRSLTQFMNTIRYEYIPAVKDSKVFDHVLTQLQGALYSTASVDVDELMDQVKSRLSSHIQMLTEEFESATGVNTQVALPKTLQGLYRLSVDTQYGPVPAYNVSLDLRGDGIRTRYLPSILHYISSASLKRLSIWGFEEPENSLEYRMIAPMVDQFVRSYSRGSQVLVTSHSPAFISQWKKANVRVARVVNTTGSTEVFFLDGKSGPSPDLTLLGEIGLTEILDELHDRYTVGIRELEAKRLAVEQLEKISRRHQSPRVLTEGRTDVDILETAWSKLRSEQCPYSLQSCDIAPNGQGGRGGATVLRQYLEVVRHDHPRIEIGLFDTDKEGLDAFGALKHFKPVPSMPGVKIHENGRAFALTLCTPPGREDFAKEKNLSIEWFFSDEILKNSLSPEGVGLTIEAPKLKVIHAKTNTIIRTEPDPHATWSQYEITNGKTVFASTIVPSLAAAEFVSFEPLLSILSSLAQTPVTGAPKQTAMASGGGQVPSVGDD